MTVRIGRLVIYHEGGGGRAISRGARPRCVFLGARLGLPHTLQCKLQVDSPDFLDADGEQSDFHGSRYRSRSAARPFLL